MIKNQKWKMAKKVDISTKIKHYFLFSKSATKE